MASPKIEVAVKNACSSIGEGPHWDVASQSLWFVDINSGGIGNWNSNTGETKLINLDGYVGFVIPSDKGGVIAGNNQNIVRVNMDTKETQVLAQVEQGKQSRFNDAKCDASGRLWAGTMGLEGEVPGVVPKGVGSLYSLDADLTLTKHVGDIDISNGLAWNDTNTVMYYIDSIPRKVYSFDFDMAQGKLSNQKDAVVFAPDTRDTYGLPDGMCIDNEGKLWVACFSSSSVYRFDPETGATLQTLKFPATNITSVCFGGKNLDELFVTCSAWNCPNPESQPLAGSIFKVTGLGVSGKAPTNFKG